MTGVFLRLVAVAALSLGLADCASNDGAFDPGNGDIPDIAPDAHVETPARPLECVPYARERSGVALYGDAGTWWAKAEGTYARSDKPLLGSVMVLTGYAGPGRAHVAVVNRMVSDREITVDHANWLDDGAIYRDDPVVDVSADNDWSEVRVYNLKVHAWGTKTYVVQGFIGPEPESRDRVAAAW
jgi:hypothetical protein